MKIDVLTLFPEMFDGLRQESIIGRAIQEGVIDFETVNFREYTLDKHNRVDDTPFGGGAGMLIGPQPVCDAIEAIKSEHAKVIYLSPKGQVFNQAIASELAKEEHLIFVCGHYEGIDERIIDLYVDRELSIGDYVLTGGEIPAMAIIDATARLLPKVLGKEESYVNDSHYNGLLEHPQYTRPREYKGLEVPEILLSGHHANIEKWRRYKSLEVTYLRRPELLEHIELSKSDLKMLAEIKNIQKTNK